MLSRSALRSSAGEFKTWSCAVRGPSLATEAVDLSLGLCGGFFTTALLWRITERASWPFTVRVGCAAANFVLSILLLLALATAAWLAV